MEDTRSKYAKMGSRKACGRCGKHAVGVNGNGWRCDEHWEDHDEPDFDITGSPVRSDDEAPATT